VDAGGEVEGDGCRRRKEKRRGKLGVSFEATKKREEQREIERSRREPDSRFLPLAFLGVFKFVLTGATGIGLDLWFDVVASPRGALVCCCWCW